jgi:hypothetical protein
MPRHRNQRHDYDDGMGRARTGSRIGLTTVTTLFPDYDDDDDYDYDDDDDEYSDSYSASPSTGMPASQVMSRSIVAMHNVMTLSFHDSDYDVRPQNRQGHSTVEPVDSDTLLS